MHRAFSNACTCGKHKNTRTMFKHYKDGLYMTTVSSNLDDPFDDYLQPGSCIVVIDENEQELR